MSKGSKRRSAKQIKRDFEHAFGDLKPAPQKISSAKPWLTMTDKEIDQTYFHFGKADRTRMKKEAAKERLRIRVRQILAEEG